MFLSTSLSFKGAHFSNLWVTTDAEKQDANNDVFYFYYEQLCKDINVSPRVTRKVTYMDGKIMHFTADRHHIYLPLRTQKGGERHLGYYIMTQEDIEEVIKDQEEIWAMTEIEENPTEDKQKKAEKE